MIKKVLDIHVQNGNISRYKYDRLDANGNIVEKLKNTRNTEQLILYFKDGSELKIGTFCSGCEENTYLDID